MGVYLSDTLVDLTTGYGSSYLKAGIRPKNATKVQKEMKRTANATLRMSPMLTGRSGGMPTIRVVQC